MALKRDRFVMIVEDEALQAFDLARTIQKAGLEAFGPFADCASALDALDALDAFVPDAALLDVRLEGDETSGKVADALVTLKVPFAFLTAYAKDSAHLLSRHADRPIYAKPCAPESVAALANMLTVSAAA